jgi:2,3,4,5-tetrahydropyridine-2-carboxylate N-succinyltransferase
MSDWEKTLKDLENGTQRAAMKNSDGQWIANIQIKKMILEAFKNGNNINCDGIYQGFVDKNTILPQNFRVENKVRMVPGGSSVRAGAYVGEGVIIMPPSYINIGAFVDSGTMVDSHVLVGSCAQIGKNVHLSAGVQIGGVLEPIGNRPVVIEDNAFLGADSVVVEGIIVRERAVIAPGVILSKGVSVYDLVNESVLLPGSDIPIGAIVVMGTRPAKSEWAKAQGLNIYAPMIIKYRDGKSDASLELEEILR